MYVTRGRGYKNQKLLRTSYKYRPFRFIAAMDPTPTTIKPPTPSPPPPSGPAIITAPPANVSAYLNDRVELKCGVKGDSGVKVSWRSRDLGEMPRVGHHYREELTTSHLRCLTEWLREFRARNQARNSTNLPREQNRHKFTFKYTIQLKSEDRVP